MNYKKLGHTGLDVSPICMGCMSLGEPEKDGNPWVVSYEASKALIKQALDRGINFFDTANIYSKGVSEEYVGRALRALANRDEIVLATKVCLPLRSGPNTSGLSRKAIFNEIDNSLRRLGTDYVDLYQIHRWDPTTPIEETLEALHDVVKAGKARYIGASSMYAWQFAKALGVAALHGWTRFVSMQNHFNLLYREEEREMLPLCADQGIAVIPWSPLARGRLTRPWAEETVRSRSDVWADRFYPIANSNREIIDEVGRIAAARGVPRAQVALAWLIQKPPITAPVVGISTLQHLEDALAALELHLSAQEIASLEMPYRPQPVSGF